MATDLQRAFDTLTAKTRVFSLLWAYYEGNQPLVYTNERLREVFQRIDARFSENWCAVVVDSEHERIRLREFSLPQPKAEQTAMPVDASPPQVVPPENPIEQRLNELFSETELNLDADDVTLAALVCGESYVFAWKDQDAEVEAYYHDPRMTHLFYDPEHPRAKQFGAKWWVNTDDEKRYLNLYYPERIEYYRSRGNAENTTKAEGFELISEAVNPMGVVPLFHFRIDRRKTTSRLDNVIELQNAVNKLFADMMVAAEFGAFKQRYVISEAGVKTLKNSPNEIWDLPASDGQGQPTSVGEFSPTELVNYTQTMDKLATSIAIITRTPKHYLMTQGGDPSGEALIAMEAPLNKKAQSSIDRFTPVWAELAAFLLRLDGVEGVQKKDIVPVFDRPETVQPRTEAEIRQMDVNTGIPLKTVLTREGWTATEIAEMEADKAEAQTQANALIKGGKLQKSDMNAVQDRLKELGIGDILEDVNARQQ